MNSWSKSPEDNNSGGIPEGKPRIISWKKFLEEYPRAIPVENLQRNFLLKSPYKFSEKKILEEISGANPRRNFSMKYLEEFLDEILGILEEI